MILLKFTKQSSQNISCQLLSLRYRQKIFRGPTCMTYFLFHSLTNSSCILIKIARDVKLTSSRVLIKYIYRNKNWYPDVFTPLFSASKLFKKAS